MIPSRQERRLGSKKKRQERKGTLTPRPFPSIHVGCSLHTSLPSHPDRLVVFSHYVGRVSDECRTQVPFLEPTNPVEVSGQRQLRGMSPRKLREGGSCTHACGPHADSTSSTAGYQQFSTIITLSPFSYNQGGHCYCQLLE